MTICPGDGTLTQHCRVLDTDAFDIVIGTDFLRRNPRVKMLSLQRPYSLNCDFGSGLFSVPLELSGRKESGLRYASKTNYRTENYQLARHVLENGLAALQVNLDEVQVELFASQQQHIMQLYCSKQLNNAFRFFWKAMGLAYANPPFSLLAKVLTKIAYEMPITSAQLSGRGELHGGARVTTLVTLRKCTLGFKREIKILKLVLASTKGF